RAPEQEGAEIPPRLELGVAREQISDQRIHCGLGRGETQGDPVARGGEPDFGGNPGGCGHGVVGLCVRVSAAVVGAARNSSSEISRARIPALARRSKTSRSCFLIPSSRSLPVQMVPCSPSMIRTPNSITW